MGLNEYLLYSIPLSQVDPKHSRDIRFINSGSANLNGSQRNYSTSEIEIQLIFKMQTLELSQNLCFYVGETMPKAFFIKFSSRVGTIFGLL